MTISAGAKDDGLPMTLLTDENIAAANLGATPDDGLDNLFVGCRQTVCESCHVFSAEFAENFRNGAHEPSPFMTSLIMPYASSWPLLVR